MRTLLSISISGAALLIAAAHLTACDEGAPSSSVVDDDGYAHRDAEPDTAEPLPPGPPIVEITSPEPGAAVAESIVITGTAVDDTGVASVLVTVGPNVPVPAVTSDNYAHWSLPADVPAGDLVDIVAIAYGVDGVASEPATVRVTRAVGSDAAAPTIAIEAPANGLETNAPSVLVSGTASDDRAVVAVDVTRNGEAIDSPITEDGFRHWSLNAPLIASTDNVFVFTARDGGGRTASATLTLHVGAPTDHTPPLLTVTAPSPNAHIAAASVTVTGTASDAYGVREVKVRVKPAGGDFGDYVAATSSDGYATWAADLAIPVGAIVIQARAFDTSGVANAVDVPVTNDFEPVWSPEQSFPLRLHDDDPPTEVAIALTREGVNAVMDEQLQRDITLLELDPTPLLVAALDELKRACGDAWMNDDPEPHHDCTLTELGQTFAGPDGTWQTSAEYSLVRLLTMTPANVDVEGTSIEGLEEIANGAILGLEIGGGFSQILAETMGIGRTDPLIATDNVVAALAMSLVDSHPNVVDGEVAVTLYDVMNGLAPLGELLGPTGDHPGVVDPSFTPSGDVLEPDFEMRLKGTSNLEYLDGIRLAGPDTTKDYLAILNDTRGPTYDDVLELDFTDPEAFDIVGLVDQPTLDLRFGVTESDLFIASCSGDEACMASLPGAPRDASSIWAQAPWQLEYGVTLAGQLQYADRVFDKCYLSVVACLARVSVGQNGDPPGWIHFGVTGNLGNPPRDQYLWELVLEVAQVALHHVGGTTIPEGAADVAFTLKGLDVGLTAEGVEAAVRPFLEESKHELGQRLFGDYTRNNLPVDFTYRRDADGAASIYFAAPGDPYDQEVYPYEAPGFFSDPELTDKLSVTSLPGSEDTAHEKLRLKADVVTVYARAADGQVYRLRFVTPNDIEEVTVHVAQKLR